MEARLESEYLPSSKRPPATSAATGSSLEPPNSYAQRMGAALKVGSRVRHPLFGAGEVLEKSGSGEGAKALIRFQNGRIAKLVLRYAPLEVI